MRRKLKTTSIIPALIFLSLLGFMQNDGNPFLQGREAYENYLLSLYGTLHEIQETTFAEQEGRSIQEEGPEYAKAPEYMDGPELASFRDYIMTMDPSTRRVPERALFKAAKLVAEEHPSGRYKSTVLFDWDEIPSNTGGRTRALMYDPNDPDQSKVWAGSVTGGLWYRDDIRGVDTWHPVNDFWPSLAISCIAYDPVDTENFYVGTGEGQTAVVIYRESSGRGSGIWRSTNAGTDWVQLETTEGFEYVTDIAIRNESGKAVIYAGVSSGIYKGKTHRSTPEDGLYRSDNGGRTWTQVLPDIPGKTTPYTPAHIEISSGNRIFVGTMRNINQEGGGRILYSDDGLNWTVMSDFVPIIEARSENNIPGRVVLAAAPSDPNRIYAIIGGGDKNYSNGFVYSRGVMIIKSSDGGKSWIQVSMPYRQGEDPGQWSFLAWHALTAVVHPTDPNVIWVGGLDLYRSDDGGWNWYQKSLWWNFGRYYVPEYPVYVHADQHSLIYRPGSKTELLNSNDGGVFIATDAGAIEPAFREVNQGYNTLQHYACAIHPQAGKQYYFGACQDNGTFRTTTIPTSKDVSVSYGDGAICFIDENEPRYQITGSQNNYFYYSSDGGHNYVYAYNFPGGTFINPVDYDHIDNILYANGMTFEGNYRDFIFRIKLVNDTLLEDEAIPARTGSPVPFSAIRVFPEKVGGNTVVFAGSQSGKLYRLDNAQAEITATEIGSNNFPTAYISCIETGKSTSRILVTFSNYGVGHVWETRDGGTTWVNKSGNLPDIPVRWAIYPPGTGSVVMLATELGIWYTEDINADPVSWVQSNDQFPNVRVDMLRGRKSDNHILAATHGRGLFLSTGAQEVGTDPSPSPKGKMLVFPNPASSYINVQLEAGGDLRVEIYNQSGQLMLETSRREAEFLIPLDGLEAGTYIIRVKTGNKEHTQTFIKKD